MSQQNKAQGEDKNELLLVRPHIKPVYVIGSSTSNNWLKKFLENKDFKIPSNE